MPFNFTFTILALNCAKKQTALMSDCSNISALIGTDSHLDAGLIYKRKVFK